MRTLPPTCRFWQRGRRQFHRAAPTARPYIGAVAQVVNELRMPNGVLLRGLRIAARLECRRAAARGRSTSPAGSKRAKFWRRPTTRRDRPRDNSRFALAPKWTPKLAEFEIAVPVPPKPAACPLQKDIPELRAEVARGWRAIERKRSRW